MTDLSQGHIACSMIVGEEVSLDLFANKLRMVAAVGVVDGVSMIVHPSMLLVMARAFEASVAAAQVLPRATAAANEAFRVTNAVDQLSNEQSGGRFEIDDYTGPVLGLIPVLLVAIVVSVLLWMAL